MLPDPNFTGRWLVGLAFLLTALVFRPSLRRRIHHRLGDLGTRGEARSAAAVAALVGGRQPAAALAHAVANFRSLPWRHLCAEDLASNADARGLSAFATPARLGDVHAFVSHSWSDRCVRAWLACS